MLCTARPVVRLLAALLTFSALSACTTLPSSLPSDSEAPGARETVTLAPDPQLAAAPTLDPSPPVPAVTLSTTPTEAAEPPAPLQARTRLDPLQDAERADLWQRVRDGYAMSDVDNDLVRKWERFYAERPDYMRRMTERSGRYLFHIVEEVERRGLPTELALLPFIESAFNPQALSRARASGMWQFMPRTGEDFDLRQNLFRDDRRDVLASTRAALDYLQRLHTLFGDWHLALAAYNWGQGNVQRALRVNQRGKRPLTYASLRMPDETRNYVPKLQAMKNLVARPLAFGLTLPPLHNHPYFLSVPIERDIDLTVAAELAGLPLDEFQLLNPQHNKPVILAAGTPQVLLPYDNANRFTRAIAEVAASTALTSWTAWVAPRTLKPSEVALTVGMTEAELREVNRIPARMLVQAGSTLLVPRAQGRLEDVSSHIAEHAMIRLTPEARPLRRVLVKASKQGETVAALAKRHRLGPAQVAKWNGLGVQSRLKPGQNVVLMLPARPTKAKRPATATRQAAQRRSVAATPSAGAAASARRPAAASPAARP